jgi:hypothetical protein
VTQTRQRPTTAGMWWNNPATKPAEHAPECACPICTGLHTFVRPRFFAGQLLTDTELTALSSYVVDKQRLHNAYLHGWGVVCGLQVECDGCGPGVLVRPGYAIDPCGYDIVAPAATSVDVLGLISQCQVSEQRLNCDPPRYPTAQGCPDQETWCLTVRYREQDARPVTPLGGTARATCSCGSVGKTSGGCGCGQQANGNGRPGWECTCGNGGSRSTTTCGCTPASTTPQSWPADCEPSRTYESYEFGVCRPTGDCHDLGARLDGTFPVKVWECIKGVQPVVSKGMTPVMQRDAAGLLLGGPARIDNSSDAVCTLYRNVLDLYRKDPLRTQCVLPEQLSEIDCTPQEQDETDEHYRQRLVTALQALVILVLLYLRDCICYSILPPCPDGACDDRVVLACLTVKDGKVTTICNQDCRHYAGSFVSRNYWLPIGPVLSWLAGLICCFPLLDYRPRYRVGNQFLAGRRWEALLAAIRRDDFAVVAMWRKRLADVTRRYMPSVVLGRMADDAAQTAEQIPLAPYVGQAAEAAAAALDQQGVQVEQVGVDSVWKAPIGRLIPAVASGGTARLFVLDGNVVAAEPSAPGQRRTARRGRSSR